MKPASLLVVAALSLAACEEPATFTRVQTEVFELNCSLAGCHAGANPAAALRLDGDDTHTRLVGQQALINAEWSYVVAGDPEASLLYLIVTDELDNGQRQMPPGVVLDGDQVALLYDWIVAGAEDD